MPCAPLSNAPDTLIQAVIKRSMSDSVVVGPRLTRTAPRASSCETPIAARTCDGWTLPEEQAAPEDTATPARSKAMTAVSAFTPGKANRVVFGNLSLPAPKITAAGERSPQTRFEFITQRGHARALCLQALAGGFGGNAEGNDAGYVLGPGAHPTLLAATLHQGVRPLCLAPDQRSHALRGPELVARNRQKIGTENIDITSHSPSRLNSVHVQQTACLVHHCRYLRDRLNDPGLVVGQHERYQGAALRSREPARQSPQSRSVRQQSPASARSPWTETDPLRAPRDARSQIPAASRNGRRCLRPLASAPAHWLPCRPT